MNKKTLKALKGSIKKWEKIVDGNGIDDGIANCPLCKLFRCFVGCTKCPVSEKVNNDCCRGTPYKKWINHSNKHAYFYPKEIECPTCKKLAQKELDFLKSLLPKETK